VIVLKGFITLLIALKGILLFCVLLQVFKDERLRRVIGNRIHGSLNILFIKVKYNNKLLKGYTILIGVLTIYIEAKESLTLVAFIK
jgi:hypothetical protein